MFRLSIVLLLLGIISCAHSVEKKELQTRQQLIMGTFISVELPDVDLSTGVFEIFKKYDKLWSTFKDDSELTRINNRQVTQISDDSFEILQKSSKLNKKTNELFSVSWKSNNIYKSNGFSLGANKINLNPGIKLNLGGVAKGYAVDRSIEYLLKNNVDRAKVSASGDIACLGQCEISIQHPFKEGVFVKVKSINNDLRVSTSGVYRQYKNNIKNHHIINPKTAKASDYLVSLSLFSKADSTQLDALATAGLAANSKEELLALMSNFIGVYYIAVNNKSKILVDPKIYSVVELSWLDLSDLKMSTKQPIKKN